MLVRACMYSEYANDAWKVVEIKKRRENWNKKYTNDTLWEKINGYFLNKTPLSVILNSREADVVDVFVFFFSKV